jgi:hypothetical protein
MQNMDTSGSPHEHVGLDSSVGIGSSYGLCDSYWGPDLVKDFPLLQVAQTAFRAHTVPYPMGTGILSQG